METVRVVLAEDDPVQRENMVRELGSRSGLRLVGAAKNGLEAIVMIHELMPDVVLCDMVMPKMDGFAVLEEITRMNAMHRPRVIALTALNRDEFIIRAMELGVSYYMVKPVNVDLLVQRICALADSSMQHSARRAAPVPETSPEQAVAELLMCIGMPAHLHGYRFLLQSVLRVLENPAEMSCITHGLYPAVAGCFGTTASRVERSIRHAINMAWDRGGAPAFAQVLKHRTFSADEKPTNCELIALLAERVRLQGLK